MLFKVINDFMQRFHICGEIACATAGFPLTATASETHLVSPKLLGMIAPSLV
jgi:hypothetical protein